MKNDSAVHRRIAQLAARLDGDLLTGLWILRAASPQYAPAYEQMGIADMLLLTGDEDPLPDTPWHRIVNAAPGELLALSAQALRDVMPGSPLPEAISDLPPLSPQQHAALTELIQVLSDLPSDAASLSRMGQGPIPLSPEGFALPKELLRLVLSLIGLREGQALYDPCYGSGSLLSQALPLLPPEQKLPLYGQAMEEASYQAGHVHAYLHGISMDLGDAPGNTLTENRFPDGKFPCILANPPFNQAAWYSGPAPVHDERWRWGLPPRSNGNFAWLQHVLYHLSEGGHGAVILPNGTLTTQTQSEREIRIQLLKAGVVEAVIALPAGIFSATRIPCCIWLLRGTARKDSAVLLVDAQQVTFSEDAPEEALKLAGLVTQHRAGLIRQRSHWYAAATLEEIGERDYILSPNFYTLAPALSPAPLRQNLPQLHGAIRNLLPRLSGSGLEAILSQWLTAQPAAHWEQAPLSQLYQITGGVVKKKEAFGHGTEMVDVATVISHAFLPDTLTARVETTEAELQKFGIQAGDILMNRSSENVEELACCCVAETDRDAVCGGYLKRLRPLENAPDSHFMAAYFRSAVYRQEIRQVSPVFTTRSNINMAQLNKVDVYYPDKAAQKALGDTMLAVFHYQEQCFDQSLSMELERLLEGIVEQFVTYPILRQQEIARNQ